MSTEKTSLSALYPNIKFPDAIYALEVQSEEQFILTIPTVKKKSYEEEATKKRDKTFTLSFPTLRDLFGKEDDVLFSAFLRKLYALLKEKRIPYVALEGFDTLTDENKQAFLDFLDGNLYLLDCPPYTPTKENNIELGSYVTCEEEALKPFLSRNIFLVHHPENEKNQELEDHWQQVAHLMVNARKASCPADKLYFFPGKSNTPLEKIYEESIYGMWEVLLKHVLIYLKDKTVANEFFFSSDNEFFFSSDNEFFFSSDNVQRPSLSTVHLQQLAQHIGGLKFNTIHLDVTAETKKDFEALLNTVLLLFENAPSCCESIKIRIIKFPDRSVSTKNKDIENFFIALKKLYKERQITTALSHFSMPLRSTRPTEEEELENLTKKCCDLALKNKRKKITEAGVSVRPGIVPLLSKPAATLWGSTSKDSKRRKGRKPKLIQQHQHQHHHHQQQQQHQHQQQVAVQWQQQVQHNVIHQTKSPHLWDKATFLAQFSEASRSWYEVFWDNVCGTEKSHIQVKWVTPSAGCMLARYNYIYQGGLIENKAGFVLEKQDDELVLNLATTPPPFDALSPLMPIPYLPYSGLKTYGTSEQFRDLNDGDKEKTSDDYFEIKYEDDLPLFIQALGDKANNIFDRYAHIFERFTNLKHVIHEKYSLSITTPWLKLITRLGANNLEYLVKALDELYQHNLNAFEQFCDNFLDHSSDFSEFVDPDSLKTIQGIAKFSPNQSHWWNTLVAEHQRYLPKNSDASLINLVDLYNGFTCFLTHYQTLAKQNGVNQDLPPVCQFKNARNLKTSLYRLLRILKNARNFSEQIQHLEDLNLGLEGADYASQFNQFSLVTREMGLSPFSCPTLYFAMIDVSSNFNIPKLNTTFKDKLPVLIASGINEHGKNKRFGVRDLLIFDGKRLTWTSFSINNEDLKNFVFEPQENPEERIRRIQILPHLLEHYLREENFAPLYVSSNSTGESFLDYTVDLDLLHKKAFDDKFPFKSQDNSLDFMQLFYRSLGKLEHTPPFNEVTELVAIITKTFKGQPENQKKLLLIFAQSLQRKQDQEHIPLELITDLCAVLEKKLSPEITNTLRDALDVTHLHPYPFNLTTATNLLNGLLLKDKEFFLDLVTSIGDIFWENLDGKNKYPNTIELPLYLQCLDQYKKNKNLLPLLNILDKDSFSENDFEKLSERFAKLSPQLKENLATLWYIVDTNAAAVTEKKLPTLTDWYNWLASSEIDKIANYPTLEKNLLACFPNLSLNVNLAVGQAIPISIEDFLHDNLSDDEKKIFSLTDDNIDHPEQPLITLFSKLQNEGKTSRLAVLFSIEKLLRIFSYKAIKQKNIAQSLEKQLMLLLTKKLACNLPPSIDSIGALQQLFTYTGSYTRFLNACDKLNPKVLPSVLLLLSRAQTLFNIQSLTAILEAILKDPQYEKAFPIDLLENLLAHQDVQIFSQSDDDHMTAVSYIILVFSENFSLDCKKLLINNFSQSIAQFNDPKTSSKQLFLKKLLPAFFNKKYQPTVMIGMLYLWHHFNVAHDTNQITELFSTILPLLEGCPENLKVNLFTYLQKHTPQHICSLVKKLEKTQDDTQSHILTILASFHCDKRSHLFKDVSELVDSLISDPKSANIPITNEF